MQNKSYAEKKYKQGRLYGASHFELLTIAYSEAILGCNNKNTDHAMTAIQVLIDGLHRQNKVLLSNELGNSFKLCQKLISQQEFEKALQLLQDLRSGWREAYQLGN